VTTQCHHCAPYSEAYLPLSWTTDLAHGGLTSRSWRFAKLAKAEKELSSWVKVPDRRGQELHDIDQTWVALSHNSWGLFS